jgi:hypothetical protein
VVGGEAARLRTKEAELAPQADAGIVVPDLPDGDACRVEEGAGVRGIEEGLDLLEGLLAAARVDPRGCRIS